jgi:hypothetical protein
MIHLFVLNNSYSLPELFSAKVGFSLVIGGIWICVVGEEVRTGVRHNEQDPTDSKALPKAAILRNFVVRKNCPESFISLCDRGVIAVSIISPAIVIVNCVNNRDRLQEVPLRV